MSREADGVAMPESWNLTEGDVTPEAAGLSRRRWLKWAGLGTLAAGAAGGAGWWWWTRGGSDDDMLASGRADGLHDELYPVPANPKFTAVDRPVMREVEAARTCNFYEFTSLKNVWRQVRPFRPAPWTVEVGGLVAKPRTFDLGDLLRAFPLEERIYRHRCVEAWAMVVPWTGVPLGDLAPQSRAAACGSLCPLCIV